MRAIRTQVTRWRQGRRDLCVRTLATNAWTTKAPMPPARSGLGVSVVNGLLYAVGGHNTSVVGQAFATVEAYEPTTNAWTTKAPMPAADYWFGVGVVNGVL